MWDLYRRLPGFVLGFHGCDEKHGREIIAGKKFLQASENTYDWLGNGAYFWEASPERARQFAQEAASTNTRVSKGSIKKPFVVGAVIDLGVCCNLLDSNSLNELALAYPFFVESFRQGAEGKELPKNRGKDNAARYLDRSVVEFMHALRAHEKLEPYDTVRGAFWEGGPLYPESGFSKKTHIQIAVRNPKCIKGYFLPIEPAKTRRRTSL